MTTLRDVVESSGKISFTCAQAAVECSPWNTNVFKKTETRAPGPGELEQLVAASHHNGEHTYFGQGEEPHPLGCWNCDQGCLVWTSHRPWPPPLLEAMISVAYTGPHMVTAGICCGGIKQHIRLLACGACHMTRGSAQNPRMWLVQATMVAY